MLARREGTELTPFYLHEYDVPYGYTPVMLARPDVIEERADALQAFLEATGRGYQFAPENPETAADRLAETADGPETPDDRVFLVESQRELADHYLTGDDGWGRMEHDRWARFVDWLAEKVDADDLYTNELLGR